MNNTPNLYHQLILDCCQRCASIRKAIAYCYAYDAFEPYRSSLYRTLHQEEKLLELLKGSC